MSTHKQRRGGEMEKKHSQRASASRANSENQEIKTTFIYTDNMKEHIKIWEMHL